MQFEGSSHQKRWFFTLEQLEKLRVRANQGLPPQQISKQLMGTDPSVLPDSPNLLSVAEEKVIVKKYCRTIVAAFGGWLKELAGQVDISHYIIKWTAATVFRRYYIYHTLADISPKEIMMGCMLLAAKIEECRRVTTDNLHVWRNRNYSVQQIVEAESEVIEGIFFDLLIFSPFVALSGLIDRLQIKCKEIDSDLAKSTSKKLSENTTRLELIKDMEGLMYTDAMFLFTPANIALAAFARNTLKEATQVLLELTPDPAIDIYFNEPVASGEEEKRIEAKLEKVRNPLYNRESAEYLQLQKQKEAQLVAKSDAKAAIIAREQEEIRTSLGVKAMDVDTKN